jgi:cell division protease FtsH
MFVGVGAARVRDLFHQAESLAPCIIFIDELDELDELDALGRARGVGGLSHEEREQTLNQLLVEMDGFDTNKGVIIMAATNRPEILDPALLRPGRFDRHVAIDRPDVRGRDRILRLHAKRLTLAPDVDLSAVAAKTAGFAGADLANIVNEAALHAARENKTAVDMRDFDAAIDRAVVGLEKKNRVISPKEKETVAYHEAGHALIAELRATTDKVSRVSIIPRGIGALGFTQQLPTEDRYLMKRSELLDRLDVLLGGRVAEKVVYGEASTGAQDDLQRATDLVRHMITQYGMSDVLGAAVLEVGTGPTYLGDLGAAAHREFSEETARRIDAEIQRLLSEAEVRVEATLTQRGQELDTLAATLLRRETVEREFLVRLLTARPEERKADAA